MFVLKHVTKRYQDTVLDDLCIEFPSTGLYLLKGPSGCGKSTLLHILGGIDNEYEGEIIWNGKNIQEIEEYQKKARFVFQQFHLLPYLNGQQNSHLSKYFEATVSPEITLDFSLKKKIFSYSGGQKQKIAIMRSLYSDAHVLLCDEPTASLDKKQQDDIIALLKELSKECLVIVSSHQLQPSLFDYCYEMEDGKIKNKDINHKHINHPIRATSRPFPLFLFAYHQCLSKAKRNSKMVIGIAFALFSILLSFSLVEATNTQVQQLIYQALPDTTISIISKDDILYYEDIYKGIEDEFVYIETDDYPCIGISLEQEYSDNILYIGDCTKECQEVSLGKIPTNSKEVVLATTTAKKLFQTTNINECLDRDIYCWYYYEGQVLSYELTVVGISEETVLLDTIYLSLYSNIEHVQTLFEVENPSVMVAMVSLDNQEDTMKQEAVIQQAFPNAKVEVSADTINNYVTKIFEQVEFILLMFCSLAIVSSCFLVGQVLFLSVVERKKEIAITRCFGATKKQVFQLVLWEALLLITLAFVLASIEYVFVMQGLNGWLEQYLAIEFIGDFLKMNPILFIIVYFISVALGLVSSFYPAFYSYKQDIITSLRE